MNEQEIARKALLDAADKWQWGAWANAPRRADRIEERLANAQYVSDWLRNRANSLISEVDDEVRPQEG